MITCVIGRTKIICLDLKFQLFQLTESFVGLGFYPISAFKHVGLDAYKIALILQAQQWYNTPENRSIISPVLNYNSTKQPI